MLNNKKFIFSYLRGIIIFFKKKYYFSWAYFKQSKCPCIAAELHVCSSHGYPFSWAYIKQSKCPLCAAHEHVCLSHGQPFSW